MSSITGLLIDPRTKVSTIVRFKPTQKNVHRLMGSDRLTTSTIQDEALCYTTIVGTAYEGDPIVFRSGWRWPVAGRVLITARCKDEQQYASLTPQQAGGCRRTHRIGTLYCAGMIEWAKMQTAVTAPSLFDGPATRTAHQ